MVDPTHFILVSNKFSKENKLVVLVDFVNGNKSLGQCFTPAKIVRNLQLIGSDFWKDLNLRLNASKEGLTFVWQFGRYVNVTQLSKDSKEGAMLFFEFVPNDTNLIVDTLQLLKEQFSENVIKSCADLYRHLSETYSENDDIIELSTVSIELN